MRLTLQNFMTNIEFSQSDALSPVLFTVYLEACMKQIRLTYPADTYELIYADEVNFISTDSIKIDEIEERLRRWVSN